MSLPIRDGAKNLTHHWYLEAQRLSDERDTLLAALEMAKRLASYGRRDGEIYDVAKAAIAKAKGGE